jgi:hypothetical protein
MAARDDGSLLDNIIGVRDVKKVHALTLRHGMIQTSLVTSATIQSLFRI